jgi:hypothetical protein
MCEAETKNLISTNIIKTPIKINLFLNKVSQIYLTTWSKWMIFWDDIIISIYAL